MRMGPKSNDKLSLYEIEKYKTQTHRRKTPCEDGGRNWRDATTSQGTGSHQSWNS